MTPKEKAKELFEKYYQLNFYGFGVYCTTTAKQCALIAVDEILKVIHTNMEDKYWQEVKQEIEKL
jgi:hypothetical protein